MFSPVQHTTLKMGFTLTTFACILIVALVFNLASVAACMLIRVPVTEFALGYGPKLIQLAFRGCRFSLGALPIGGYVGFDTETLARRSMLSRLFVIVAGLIATIIVGFSILGFSSGLHHFVGSFSHLISGAFSPLIDGQALVGRFAELSSSSFLSGLGVFLLVSSAYNLLPARVVSGGRFVAEITPSSVPVYVARGLDFITIFFFYALTLSWTIAILTYIL